MKYIDSYKILVLGNYTQNLLPKCRIAKMKRYCVEWFEWNCNKFNNIGHIYLENIITTHGSMLSLYLLPDKKTKTMKQKNQK